MTKESVVKIRDILAPYLKEQHVKEMKGFVQHGNVSTYQHCLNVTFTSYAIAMIFDEIGIHIDITTLIVGAFLHDFYLYDWHTGRLRKEGIHGLSHPLVAMRNANQYFNLSNKTSNIIESHMFPLTLTHVPKSKEAVIVSIADKYCAIKEMLHIT